MSSLPSVRKWILVALGVASLAYPFAVYFTIHTVKPVLILGALLGLLGLRFLFAPGAERRNLAPLLLAATVVVGIAYWEPSIGMKAYPVLVNAVLAITFALSLWFPPTAIERIARIREPSLPPAGVAYTRKVTYVWTSFFVINGLISGWTAVSGSLEAWTLYNGLIAYVAIGVVFGTEYVVRLTLRHRLRQPT